MRELRRCPFCGGEAEIVELGKHVWSPRCMQCECKLNQVYRTQQQAIEAWNRREPMDKIVEQLEIEKERALELFDGNSRYKGYARAIEIVKKAV